MNFYVIGSNSFSGSHFIDYLLGKNHSVIGVSRSEEINPVFLAYKNNSNKSKFTFLKRNLNTDSELMLGDLSRFDIDYVVNFAAQGMVAQSWEKPEDWYETNFVGNVKFHDKLRQYSKLKKYVHVSTPEVYGSTASSIVENYNYNPSTPYAVSRAACDLSLMAFHKNYNFPVVFTRAANVYGPGQQLYRIIPKAALCILLGKKIPLHGGGVSLRSFIHMQDVCSATYQIATKAVPPDVFHISTEEEITIRSLVETICEKLNKKFNDCVDLHEERPGKDFAYHLNSNKLRKSFDWSPKVSLDVGLDETLRWVCDNIEELRKIPDYYIHKT